MFDTLVTVIALQLLASCSTFLPPSSAESLPLYQQRTEKQIVSALQSHTQHRFSPAAGHHARAPSETAPWPGLCAFPAPKQTSLEWRAHKRERTSSSEYTPTFSGSAWTDGSIPESFHEEEAHEGHGKSSPAIEPHATDYATVGSQSPTNGRSVRFDNISSSTSEDEPNFLSKLMCQPSTSKNSKRKPNSRVQKLLRKKSAQQTQIGHNGARPPIRWNHPSKLQQLTSQAAQRIPSAIRLRRTQSAPRNAAKKADQVAEYRPRRRSSNPSIGSPLSYYHEIPQIRRTSATPAASNNQYASTNGSLRGLGRRELSPNPEDTEEAQRYQIELWQSKALFPPRQMKNTQPPSLKSPAASIEIRRHTSPVLYLNRLHPDEHALDKLHDPNAAGNDNSDADPDTTHCPRRQTGSTSLSHHDQEDSSDSELERTRKRKSIFIRDSSVGSAMAGMFGPASAESSRR